MLSVVLPHTANAIYSVHIQIKLLAFSFLSPQRRSSSHGHARKRAKVWPLLMSRSSFGHPELSHDPSLRMVLSKSSLPRSNKQHMMVQDSNFLCTGAWVLLFNTHLTVKELFAAINCHTCPLPRAQNTRNEIQRCQWRDRAVHWSVKPSS